MKYLDLFSGCGGMSFGFHESKFICTGAVDFWKPAEDAYRENFPNHEFRNLDLFKHENVLELIEWQRELSPDIIVGGPPCQGFSTLGSRNNKDKRNNLIETFLFAVKNIGPSYFIMENVKAIGNTKYNSKINYDEFIKNYSLDKKIGNASYNIFKIIMNSLDFGAAQTRQRSFYIGINEKIKMDKNFLEEKINSKKSKPMTLQDVIFDLPRLSAGEGADLLLVGDKVIHNHKAMGHGAELVRRFKCVPPGGGLLDVDDKYLTPHLLKMKNGGYGSGGHVKNIYGRLEWDKPCGTIIAGMDKITCGRYLHPDDDRLLTPRECARIQTFPDKFKFSTSQVNQYYLIGNAVPPLFSRVLASVIKSYEQRYGLVNARTVKKQELNL